MIRYYTYYNCGGYKDMFLGSDSNGIQIHYYIPLLPRWENNPNPENEKMIAKAKAIAQIKLITRTDNHGFPNECKILFSCGGYKAIYQTLQNGAACFCIRDIKDNKNDEEDRETPFNFLFIAEDDESIKKLDNLAMQYLKDSKRVEDVIRDSISFDININGMKFDLPNIEKELLTYPAERGIEHINGRVVYLKLNNNDINKALSEQNINHMFVDAICDNNNNTIKGRIRFKETHAVVPEKGPSDEMNCNTDENTAKPDSADELTAPEENNTSAKESIPSSQDKEDTNEATEPGNTTNIEIYAGIEAFKSIITDKIEKITQKAPSSEEIANLKRQIQDISDSINDKYNQLTALIKELKDPPKNDSSQIAQINSVSDLINYLKGLTGKEMTTFLLIMIVGVILGALIF